MRSHPMEALRFQSALKNHIEHAQILGLIADTCNLIEKVLCEAAAILLSISDEAAETIIYSLQASRSRLDVVAAIVRRFASERARDQYLGQIETARQLFSRRNAMVHNIWDTRNNKAAIFDLSKPPSSRA